MRINFKPCNTLPTEIKLHQKSAVLEISFEDGAQFNLPCEFLRVFTPSAEAVGHGPGQETLQTGKAGVTINEIQPIGNYGIAPVFSDGHNTGIFTWDLLYKLGTDYAELWSEYLQRLEQAGQSRQPSQADGSLSRQDH